MTVETHPFGKFVPVGARYLLLGSFTGRQTYDWFYGASRSQFWPIVRKVYTRELETKIEKVKLFTELKLAISDIIYQCERKRESNLDVNLTNIVYNLDMVEEILKENKIEKVFFSSRFVEIKFRQIFKRLVEEYPNTELITLPSPSPRYAVLKLEEKTKIYKKLLPKLS